MIHNKQWIKEADIVNFSLPITIRLSPCLGTTPGSPGNFGQCTIPVDNLQDNNATLDLGPSLGTHQIGLAGKLHGNLQFISSFDAGQPGNTKLTLTPDNTSGLATTSVPLLSNSNVTGAGPSANSSQDGCVGVDTTGAYATSLDNPATLNNSTADALGGQIPGYNAPFGDQPDPTTDTTLGAAPSGQTDPSAGDVVLRTGALSVGIAPQGPAVAGSPVAGQTIGYSGGDANLFGLGVDGTNSSVDVKVNLFTNINSILKSVDYLSAVNDSKNGTYTDCRQAWTGTVPNYLTAALTGSLRIAPAITQDGYLRIATTQLSSPTPSAETVAACLVPDSFFDGAAGDPTVAPNATPVATPSEACNSAGSPLNAAGLVQQLQGGVGSNLTNGAEVKVAGTLSVNKLDAEVLIGTL